MKLKCEVEISASPAEVWAALDNRDRQKAWQPALERVEQVSGKPGERGSVTRRLYKDKGKTTTVMELVTERREPHFSAGTRETPTYSAMIVNHFEKTAGGTRWVVYADVTPKGWRRIAMPFGNKSIVEDMDADLQRFKLMLETDLADK